METNVPQAPAANLQQTPAASAAAVYSRLGVAEFKSHIGASALDVVRNPKTGKLFVSASNGAIFRCQGDLDTSVPMEFLIVDGDVSAACLINKGRGANTIISL